MKSLFSLSLCGFFVFAHADSDCQKPGILIKRSDNEFQLSQTLNMDNIIPLLIIGSGPAGLTAAMYGCRAGVHTVIFTGDLRGGQLTLTTEIENWPGVAHGQGPEIMDALVSQAEEYGAKIVEDTIVKVDYEQWPFVAYTGSGEKIHALSMIVATGAAPRKLGIPGELEYWGRGVTACATCDCHFFKGKDVVVVGGGDSAVEEAVQLSPYAKKVSILVRTDRMRAADRVQSKLHEYDNIEVVYNKQVLEVVGDGAKVTGLRIKDIVTGEEKIEPYHGLFLAIGQNPNTGLFDGKLELNRFGYVCIDPSTQETSQRGVFAAGDVEDAEYRQAVVASGSGCKAALRAVKFLREVVGFTNFIEKKLRSKFYLR